MDEEEEEEEEEVPTKAVVEDVQLEVKCGIKFIDFEGRSDGRSIRNIIGNIAPRKLILVHGEPKACLSLQESLSGTDSGRSIETILVAESGKEMDVTTDTSIWKAELKDSVVADIEFSEVDGYEVAYIDAQVAVTAAGDGDDVQMEEGEEKQEAKAYLTSLPEDRVPGHDAVFVGDLPLKEFKRVLSEHNFSVAFQKGVLVCNNVVTVRKVAKGAGQTELALEGPLCDEYYIIRDLLYGQFCLL